MAFRNPFRPTREQLVAAKNRTLPDVIGPNLTLLLVGINPGLYTAAIGCHFGRPGNRFWPALHLAGITPRLFSPFEQDGLLDLGVGITNVVDRATATADEVGADEMIEGGRKLEQKVVAFQPRAVAILGIGAYRTAFARPKAKLGEQQETLGGRPLGVLPNPSGLNAHFSLEQLGEQLRITWQWAQRH